MDDGTEIM